MKKYAMLVFSILMVISLVLPLTVRADKERNDRDMKGEGMSIERGHHDAGIFRDLDEDILKKMQELRLKNKEEMLDLRTRIEKKELEMEKVLLKEKLDLNKVLSINDEISDLKQKISRKKIEQKIEMYKLLPDGKKEEATKMFIKKFLRKGHGKYGKQEKSDKPGCPMKK